MLSLTLPQEMDETNKQPRPHAVPEIKIIPTKTKENNPKIMLTRTPLVRLMTHITMISMVCPKPRSAAHSRAQL